MNTDEKRIKRDMGGGGGEWARLKLQHWPTTNAKLEGTRSVIE